MVYAIGDYFCKDGRCHVKGPALASLVGATASALIAAIAVLTLSFIQLNGMNGQVNPATLNALCCITKYSALVSVVMLIVTGLLLLINRDQKIAGRGSV